MAPGGESAVQNPSQGQEGNSRVLKLFFEFVRDSRGYHEAWRAVLEWGEYTGPSHGRHVGLDMGKWWFVMGSIAGVAVT